MEVLHPNIRVPFVLLARPDLFGGHRDGAFLCGGLVRTEGSLHLAPPETSCPAQILLPRLVEAHCHLDKCHSVFRLGDTGGDLLNAIAAQSADKLHWNADDLLVRAERGSSELIAAGCGLVRSHVDWGPDAEPPLSWHVLRELAQERRGEIRLELAALTALQQLADPVIGPSIARRVAQDGGALGAFVLHQPERRAGIRAAIALADRFGLALDFHVDEGLEPGLDGLPMIAEEVIASGFQGPVLCGHACSLMTQDGRELEAVIDLVARAGLFVAALPTTNLYLQGRAAGTPDRRGITRLRELHEAGVRIVIASDNVGDAFCPTGHHDPMAALHLSVLAAHLDPPLDRWLPAITTNAAQALGHGPAFIDQADLKDLCVSTVDNLPDLLAGRGGKLRPLPQLSNERQK